jgi:hypothetical protein
LRIFSAKVDFLAFYVLFWAFFGLDTESEHITALQLHTLESCITLVSCVKSLLYESERNKFRVNGEIGKLEGQIHHKLRGGVAPFLPHQALTLH